MENLRPNTIKDIRRLGSRLAEGRFERRTVALLLIKLRGVYESDSLLADIANYVAHDYRNRGESYKLAERLMNSIGNFMEPTEEGAHVLKVPKNTEMTSQQKICKELAELLVPFGIIQQKILNRQFKIMLCILENIEEATMYVQKKNEPYLTECKISKITHHETGVRFLTFSTKVIGNSEDGKVNIQGSSASMIFLQAIPDGSKPYNMGGLQLTVGGQ